MSADTQPQQVSYQRIAAEEAFGPAELIKEYRKLLASPDLDDVGFRSLWGFYLGPKSPPSSRIVERLQDLGERRIQDMDQTGISKQIIALTAPGVQVFDAAKACGLAILANDQLAEATRNHPERFAGLVAIAPQAPSQAAKEIERGIHTLGLKGVLINSHTQGHYLDDQRFWGIFEAAEAANAPIYLHPNTPSNGLIAPMLERGLDGAVFGFAVETALHLLRIIVSGAFDRFPSLRIVLGHCGEALPFWLYRLDYMHGRSIRAHRYPTQQPLKRTISEYLRENVYVTTSGMAWQPAILFCREVLGPERVLYAMDYPYQFAASEVSTCDGLPLTEPEKKQFFQTNAERLFSL